MHLFANKIVATAQLFILLTSTGVYGKIKMRVKTEIGLTIVNECTEQIWVAGKIIHLLSFREVQPV